MKPFKPRIFLKQGIWICKNSLVNGYGSTIFEAYRSWSQNREILMEIG